MGRGKKIKESGLVEPPIIKKKKVPREKKNIEEPKKKRERKPKQVRSNIIKPRKRQKKQHEDDEDEEEEKEGKIPPLLLPRELEDDDPLFDFIELPEEDPLDEEGVPKCNSVCSDDEHSEIQDVDYIEEIIEEEEEETGELSPKKTNPILPLLEIASNNIGTLGAKVFRNIERKKAAAAAKSRKLLPLPKENDTRFQKAIRINKDGSIPNEKEKYKAFHHLRKDLQEPVGFAEPIAEINAERATIQPSKPAIQNPRFLKNFGEVDRMKQKTIAKSIVHRGVPWPLEKSLQDPTILYTKPGDIHCFWCTECFKNIPYPAALRYTPGIDQFHVTGCFCSPACSNAWVFQREGSRKLMVNLLMFKRVYNLKVTENFHKAPPREALIKFGGYLTLEAFRGMEGKVDVEIHQPPFISMDIGLTELENIVIETSAIYKDGFEELYSKLSRLPANSVAPTMIVTGTQGYQMQKGHKTQMPTIEEQIRLATHNSNNNLKIARVEAPGTKQRRSLKDFMRPVTKPMSPPPP